MSSVDKEILAFIKKIKLRIHLNIIINYIIWGIIGALFCGAAVSISALLFPLYKVYLIALKLAAIGAGIAFLVSLTMVPKNYKAAAAADSMGLKERAVTSLELIGNEENFALLQKKDTLSKLRKLDYKEKLKFKINRKQIILFIVFVFIITGTNFIPTKAKDKAQQKYRFNITQEEKIASIEKVEKDIKKNSTLKEEDKKELLDNLTSLRKEIKEAQSLSEIDNSLSKFQIKTDEIKDKYKENDLNNVASGLSRNNYTNNLANAIERGDKEEIAREISNLPQTMQGATEEEQKKVGKDFADTAKNTEDSELKKSLNDIAEKLASNNPEKLKELANSLNNFNESLGKPMDNKYAKNELKDIQSNFMPENKVADNSQHQNQSAQTGNNPQSGNQQGQNGSNTGNTSPNGNNEQGQKPGGNSENPENKSSDNENKSGDNKEKPNQNNGSSSDNSGKTGSSGGNSDKGSTGLNKTENGNAAQGEDVYLPPPPDSKTAAENSKPQDLSKVIGKYKEKAYENMNSYVIPEAMKDIIKNYFTSLEQ
ncbi:hypothetical protein JK636_18490 [Clostridium sp. YIM B02515]|uniref:Uncharacterized protein n=1 Tax=Clostridium rhizosphaerae TaxID=2803861 RepID=A0ABS1TIB9_9CLOT|nr:hypothetical protein [Clostridium rhizosphaerae]MBL4937703.1 hypothetical protein [Clostridium rhizosphaerae]